MTLRLLTIPEAADAVGRSPDWIEARIAAGDLAMRRYGRRRYVAERDLIDLLPGEGERKDPRERIVVMPKVWT